MCFTISFLFLLQEYYITVARDIYQWKVTKKEMMESLLFFTLSPPLNRWKNTFTNIIIALRHKIVNIIIIKSGLLAAVFYKVNKSSSSFWSFIFSNSSSSTLADRKIFVRKIVVSFSLINPQTLCSISLVIDTPSTL